MAEAPNGHSEPLPLRAIGLGNGLCGDDAAGLLVAERLAGRGVDAIRCEGEPISLLEAWSGERAIAVVDAVAGERPGRVWRLDPLAGELPLQLNERSSTHLLGLSEVVELARALGRLPRELTVIGIEGERFAPGSSPSEPVERAVDTVVAALLAESRARVPAAPVAGALG